jgi:hypothetical protein
VLGGRDRISDASPRPPGRVREIAWVWFFFTVDVRRGGVQNFDPSLLQLRRRFSAAGRIGAAYWQFRRGANSISTCRYLTPSDAQIRSSLIMGGTIACTTPVSLLPCKCYGQCCCILMVALSVPVMMDDMDLAHRRDLFILPIWDIFMLDVN